MEYKAEKLVIEGRSQDAPQKYKMSFIKTVKDENGNDVRILELMGNITLEHLKEAKENLKGQLTEINNQISVINTKL